MERQTDKEKIKNVLAFLAIIFGETSVWSVDIMNIPPDYLLEKFNRYVHSLHDEWQSGLHPTLRRDTFDHYIEKWKMDDNGRDRQIEKNDCNKD